MATKARQPNSVNAAFFDDLVRCETRIYNGLNDALREAHGIVTSQFEFLRFLRDHDEPRVADIAAAAAIGVGAVSKSIDRLEARGLAARRPNPNDRRSALLALTDEGRALADAAEATFARWLAEHVAGAVGSERLAEVARTLATLRAALERQGVGTPTG